MDIPVLFEDESLILIDKPSSVVVNKSLTSSINTIQDWAHQRLNFDSMDTSKESDFYLRAGIVHRLDKETSGILLIAKNEQMFLLLQKQFGERTVQKKYYALGHGKITPPQGTINAPVGRLPWDRMKFGVLEGGREAQTDYQVEKVYSWKKEFFTLIVLTPHTGRTHQIRIHLKYIGHPIVSDPLYAGRKVFKKDLLICPRLFLHAFYLSFMHPKSGKTMEIQSQLPQQLKDTLDKLEIVS